MPSLFLSATTQMYLHANPIFGLLVIVWIIAPLVKTNDGTSVTFRGYSSSGNIPCAEGTCSDSTGMGGTCSGNGDYCVNEESAPCHATMW